MEPEIDGFFSGFRKVHLQDVDDEAVGCIKRRSVQPEAESAGGGVGGGGGAVELCSAGACDVSGSADEEVPVFEPRKFGICAIHAL